MGESGVPQFDLHAHQYSLPTLGGPGAVLYSLRLALDSIQKMGQDSITMLDVELGEVSFLLI